MWWNEQVKKNSMEKVLMSNTFYKFFLLGVDVLNVYVCFW